MQNKRDQFHCDVEKHDYKHTISYSLRGEITKSSLFLQDILLQFYANYFI